MNPKRKVSTPEQKSPEVPNLSLGSAPLSYSPANDDTQPLACYEGTYNDLRIKVQQSPWGTWSASCTTCPSGALFRTPEVSTPAGAAVALLRQISAFVADATPLLRPIHLHVFTDGEMVHAKLVCDQCFGEERWSTNSTVPTLLPGCRCGGNFEFEPGALQRLVEEGHLKVVKEDVLP